MNIVIASFVLLLDIIAAKDAIRLQSLESLYLKDKSRVVIIVDYSRGYTNCEWCVVLYLRFFSLLICEAAFFDLLRSAK